MSEIQFQNTFIGGMKQDYLDSLSDGKSYYMARNAVKSTRDSTGFGLTNEGSNSIAAGIAGLAGAKYCDDRNWTVLFHGTDTISIFDHATKKVTEVMSASEFGCSFGFTSCDWIGNGRVEFHMVDPGRELHVKFSSGCEYYSVNIDLMLNPDRKAGLKSELDCETKCGYLNNCDYFKVSKKVCSPIVTGTAHSNNGGSYGNTGGGMRAGAYVFFTRQHSSDGVPSNWSHPSDPVFVGSEHNIAGEPTGGYIDVNISCSDCKYPKMELAVMKMIGGTISVEKIPTYFNNNHHFSYRYTGSEGEAMDPVEILTRDHMYIRGKYLEQKDGHMLYYGIKSRRNPNLQPLANMINVEYVIYEMPYSQVKKNNIKSLMRGETYAFAVIYNYADGTHSHAFHIPGIGGGGGNAGGQDTNLFQFFNEQPNSNANLTFTGGYSFANQSITADYSVSNTLCEYTDIDPYTDISYYSEIVPGDYDILKLNITGDTTGIDLIECIKRCDLGDRTMTAVVHGHEDKDGNVEKIKFKVQKIIDSTTTSIELGGITNINSKDVLDAAKIVITCKKVNSGGGTSGSNGGGGGSSAVAGGASSCGTCSPATIETKPKEEYERKREKVPNKRVWEPQNDHYDEIVNNVLKSMSTEAKRDMCKEVKLWEEQLRSHCCNCSDVPYCEEDICLCNGFQYNCYYASDGNYYDDDGNECLPNTCPDGSSCEVNDCTASGCCGGPPCPEGSAYERCMEDIEDVDNIFSQWEDLLDWYNQDELEPEYTSSKIYSGARAVQESIMKRERVERKKRMWNVSGKSSNYTSGPSGSELNRSGGNIGGEVSDRAGVSKYAGPLFDCFGNANTEFDIKEVSSGSTEPDFEQDITYPCQTDCDGNFIYGGLAGSPVAHHKFPGADREPHFASMGIGVPYGKYWTDADEISDLYIRIMGPRFNNIPIPSEDMLPKPLCPTNPFTIGMVERTESNKKVIMKGLATGTFKISNNDKDYDHPRHGCNSLETVSYYHDKEGNRRSGAGSGSSHTLYSLDGGSMMRSLNADKVKEELRLEGQGERYGLYAKGTEPDDVWRGRRIDSLGATQSVNLNGWSAGGGESELGFKEYVDGNSVAAPGGTGIDPLMNRSGQPCVWFGSGLEQITDKSFTGDVLQHNVPIPEAKGQYVSFIRDLPNQYGNLENLNYRPLLQAGKNTGSTIEGPVGDIFIGPYSFVKTGFVSDKVGSEVDGEGKFDIPNMLPHKKEKRCLCDGPEDVIFHQNGLYVWTELPEESDAAEPKNWMGTHTEGEGGDYTETLSYEDSVGQAPISDMYFPGTVTTNITYVGEFETCPWLREKSDELYKSWYSEGLNRSKYRFVSGNAVDQDTSGWEDAYLNQFGRKIYQPSRLQKVLKGFVRILLNIVFPAMGLSDVFDITNGGLEITGDLTTFPMLVVLWYLLSQVLFRNEKLDQFLGIPVCKSDEREGFKETYNKGLFFNPTGYNPDYSLSSTLYTYEGMPDPYYTCAHDECPTGGNIHQEGMLSNEIFVSEKQVQGSIIDSYKVIRPGSKIDIPANQGYLRNLFSSGGTLFAHTTDNIIPLLKTNFPEARSYGEIIARGSPFVLNLESISNQGVTEGKWGLRRHNEHLDSQYGYFFVDSEADIIYRMQGSTPVPISKSGMWNFFKEKLNFCDITGCMDEKLPGTAYYSLGVDPRHERFLITKSDGNNSFTISYDIDDETWISFHDYIPREYISDRRDMYTINDSGIWLHNQDCNFQTFYGQYHPFEVEFIASTTDLNTYNWESVVIGTEAKLCSGCAWIDDLDVTFNKMALWNSTQGSGTKDIRFVGDNQGFNGLENAYELIKESSNVDAVKKRRLWYINQLRDERRLDCRAEPMTVCERCQPTHGINEAIFDCTDLNKQDFKNKVMVDRWFRYRLTFDLDPNVNLNLLHVTTIGNKTKI